MAFYQDGKAVFAKAMGKLVERMPLDSITVNDIVAEASASRTTFYRYFKDKNDLLAYVYTKMASDLIEHAERMHKSNYDLALDIIEYINSRPEFFRKAFADNGQNSFYDTYCGYTCDVWVQRIRKADNCASEVVLLVAKAYAIGTCAIVKEWVLNGYKDSAQTIARACDSACPQILKEYKECAEESC